jgi:signal transduction histidine kinase/ActR/RegA family two-component response regulator
MAAPHSHPNDSAAAPPTDETEPMATIEDAEIKTVEARENAIDSREAAILKREGATDLREHAARLREQASGLREELASFREQTTLLRSQTDAVQADDVARRVAAMRDANEQLVFATIRAQALAEAAEETHRRQEEFVAMLAHELRNPLAPIRNAVAILGRIKSTEPVLHWAVEIINRQVDHMARLLDDLFEVARLTTGKITLQRQAVALSVIVEQSVEACRPLFDRRTQHVDVEIPSLPAYVNGDPIRLSQVFSNLLNNASKYTQEGGTIAVSAQVCNQMAIVRVSDTGRGIAPEELPHIFDLFVQMDHTSGSPAEGLGIGLTVAQQMVKMHGGTIDVHSAGLGQGTEFVVTLPLMTEVAGGAVASAPLAPTVQGHGCRIVIADDNVDVNDSLRMLLQMAGHEVSAAFDGATAIRLVQANRPQIVLCDIGLPGLDGYAVIRELRAQMGEAMPVMVAITGFGQASDRERALAAGFDHHLVKPVDPALLLQMIASQADLMRAPSQNADRSQPNPS